MLLQFTSYSQYLAAELDLRKARNPLYSLRVMSQQLGISPATLSDVIKGRKKLSEKTAQIVSTKLKLNAKEKRYFQVLVAYENSQDINLKKILESQLKTLSPQLRQSSELPEDLFVVLSEWHHIAILELTYVYPKNLNSKIISEQLNIDVTKAEEALTLLEKLSLIEKTNTGIKKTKNQFTFSSTIANRALRHFHSTMLHKAQVAVTEQTNHEKMIGSETFPLGIEDLDEAKNIIENCFQQLLQLSQESSRKTHVYHAGIQLFQLNRPRKIVNSDD